MKKEELDVDRIFVLHDFLSGGECSSLIQRSEGLGYEPAPVGDVVTPEVRNNERVIIDDAALAADLFLRARLFLPAVIDDEIPVGFNERFRFYRYGPGHCFKPHPDGAFGRLERCEESLLTFMVYLNDQVEGGETKFYAGLENVSYGLPSRYVRPKTGMALAFVHTIWHEGAVVRSGRKYVMRTDVMYTCPSPRPDDRAAQPVGSGGVAGRLK
jgi:prolyl 4-hydroxylase